MRAAFDTGTCCYISFLCRCGRLRLRVSTMSPGSAGGRTQIGEFRYGRGEICFHAADRIVERSALDLDVTVGKRRIESAQLSNQRRSRALVNCAPRFRRRIGQAFDGSGDQGIVISHWVWDGPRRFCRQPSNGFFIRIVSSRSGEVDRSATGAPINSSTRRTYLIACAGRSAHERAPAVDPLQPSISS